MDGITDRGLDGEETNGRALDDRQTAGARLVAGVSGYFMDRDC